MASESDEATDASRRNIRTTGGVSVRHLPRFRARRARSRPCPPCLVHSRRDDRATRQRAGGRSAVQLLGYPEVVTSQRAERCVRGVGCAGPLMAVQKPSSPLGFLFYYSPLGLTAFGVYFLLCGLLPRIILSHRGAFGRAVRVG